MALFTFPSLPSRSAYPSRKDWEAACWRSIRASPDLIDALMTSHERSVLVMRVAVREGLAEGKSYRKIGEELWVSPQTISVTKKALAEKAFRSYRQRSKTERKKKTSHGHARKFPVYGRMYGKPRRTKYGTVYVP